jgi:outer membrane protein assembly factor BamB
VAAGVSLNASTGLVSPTGLYQAVMQTDGSFVVYKGNNQTGSMIWATNTSGFANSSLKFQTDGNLALYINATTYKWSSGTTGTAVTTLKMLIIFFLT